MSLQDKISSAKPNTFLTDGLSEEEVKQAVEEGRRRSMKLIIDIPKELMEYIKTNGCLSVIYIDEVAKAIQNGIPLDDVIGKIEKLNPVDYGSMFSYESHNGAKDMQRDILDILDNIDKESEEE